MSYSPAIRSARPLQRFPIGHHTAVLLGYIEPAGLVEYAFVMVVFDNATEKPCYFVASEVSTTAGAFGGGSHFLGVFDGDMHVNYGASDDWADEAKFTAEALQIIRSKFEAPPEKP